MAAEGGRRVGTLLFVYNADSDLLAAAWDAAHKLLSPGTYPCDLCAITHGALSMRHEWRAYVDNLPYDIRFLHKDEFREAYPQVGTQLPAILREVEGGLPKVLVSAAEMHRDQSVSELAALLDRALVGQDGQRV